MAVPIWKDQNVILGQGDSILYRIVLSDTSGVIFSGKAYRKPGETSISCRINDICADYLESFLSQGEFPQVTQPVSFLVQSSANGTSWTTKATIQFLNDWSYDYSYDPETMGMSFPINGRIDSRMPIIWTGLGVSSVTATIYFADGTTTQASIPADGGTAMFLPSAWDNVEKIVVGNSTFQVVTDCAEYALYYVNAYGGWDCFLIEGNAMETDTIKRYTREVIYDNRDIEHRGTDNYVNEIQKGFTLHTGWLINDQGKRMHHLVNSTNVYLYDIASDEIIPVTIPGTTCEYKTFRNQGNRLVNYAIQVQVAQNRLRR